MTVNQFTDGRAITARELTLISEAIAGNTYAIAGVGGAVTVSAGMTLSVSAVAANALTINGTVNTNAYAGGTVNITAADATNPRRDLVIEDSTGAVSVLAGTPVAVTATTGPVCPTPSATQYPLAEVYVGAGVTSIVAGNITDRRQVLNQSMRLVGSALSPATTTSTSAVDLVTISNLNIPVTSAIRITFNYRRTGGAGGNVGSIGLKLNSTVIVEPNATAGIAWTTAINQAEDGFCVVDIGPRSANYLNGWRSHFSTYVSSSGAAAIAGTWGVPNGGAAIPNAAVTSVILRAINNTSNVNIEVANVKVYEVL